jgi:hypothetical protein
MPLTYNDLSAWQKRQVDLGHDLTDWQRESLDAVRCPTCQGTGTGTSGVSGRACATCDRTGINPARLVDYLRNQGSAGRTFGYDRSERTCGLCGGKSDRSIDLDGVTQRAGEMFCTRCGVTAAVAPDVLFALANVVATAQNLVAASEEDRADDAHKSLCHLKSMLVALHRASVTHDTHVALEGRL